MTTAGPPETVLVEQTPEPEEEGGESGEPEDSSGFSATYAAMVVGSGVALAAVAVGGYTALGAGSVAAGSAAAGGAAAGGAAAGDAAPQADLGKAVNAGTGASAFDGTPLNHAATYAQVDAIMDNIDFDNILSLSSFLKEIPPDALAEPQTL